MFQHIFPKAVLDDICAGT